MPAVRAVPAMSIAGFFCALRFFIAFCLPPKRKRIGVLLLIGIILLLYCIKSLKKNLIIFYFIFVDNVYTLCNSFV